MPYTSKKQPLYRKVNTRTHGVHHRYGGDYRHVRKDKDASGRGSMHGTKQRGLDYTPLFRFLRSKVGQVWDEVFSEAVARLDKSDPIFWVVARHEYERLDVVRVGESTFMSGLYVDDDGLLQYVNPELSIEHMTPSCACCTHTFNGVRFG